MGNCNIVKDLLPLYAEGLASDDSAKLIEAHLETCADCRAEWESLKQGAGVSDRDYSAQAIPLKKIKKVLRKKKALLIVAAALLLLALLAVIAVEVILPKHLPFLRRDESPYHTEEDLRSGFDCVITFNDLRNRGLAEEKKDEYTLWYLTYNETESKSMADYYRAHAAYYQRYGNGVYYDEYMVIYGIMLPSGQLKPTVYRWILGKCYNSFCNGENYWAVAEYEEVDRDWKDLPDASKDSSEEIRLTPYTRRK